MEKVFVFILTSAFFILDSAFNIYAENILNYSLSASEKSVMSKSFIYINYFKYKISQNFSCINIEKFKGAVI